MDTFEFKFISVVIILLISISFLSFFSERETCSQKYGDTKYSMFSWCMIKYEWKYIPEDLYEKAFIQNVNLITK